MSFNINPEYLNAVQNFDLSGSSTLPANVSEADLDALVNEVAQSIIAAEQTQIKFSQNIGRELSLHDTFYLIVQDNDGVSNSTLTKIKEASSDRKTILSHAYGKLETKFITSMEKASIQAATILFGINIEARVTSPEEELLKLLAQLNGLTDKYSIALPGDITALFEARSMPASTPAVAASPATPEPASDPAEASPAVAPAKKDA